MKFGSPDCSSQLPLSVRPAAPPPSYNRQTAILKQEISTCGPQTRCAKNRTDAFEGGTWIFIASKLLFVDCSCAPKNMRPRLPPSYNRKTAMLKQEIFTYLPQKRHAKKRTDALEEGTLIFIASKLLFIDCSNAPKKYEAAPAAVLQSQSSNFERRNVHAPSSKTYAKKRTDAF